MKKSKCKIQLLEVGKDYYIMGTHILVVPADKTGCTKCVFIDDCARFEVKSDLLDLHALCGGCFREDKQSVVFTEYKHKAPNSNDNE